MTNSQIMLIINQILNALNNSATVEILPESMATGGHWAFFHEVNTTNNPLKAIINALQANAIPYTFNNQYMQELNLVIVVH